MFRDKSNHIRQAGIVLPVALCLMTLCFTMSVHILSLCLEQDKALHREFTAFKEQLEQDSQQALARRARQRGSLVSWLNNNQIQRLDWVPDHLAMGCDTGVLVYRVPAETAVYEQRRHEPDMLPRIQAAQFQYQQTIPWVDAVLVDNPQAFFKQTLIHQDSAWMALSAALHTQPRLYALTAAGELMVYDAQRYTILSRYPLGQQIADAQDRALDPERWQGYLVTHTVQKPHGVFQLLWVILQHPESTDVLLWPVDISDPNTLPLPQGNPHRMPGVMVSNMALSNKPIGMMHPYHRRPGLMWTAVDNRVPVIQWIEPGACKPETWEHGERGEQWVRLMAIDRWQRGYPDRLYVWNAEGHIWKGDFFSGSFEYAFEHPLKWSLLYRSSVPGVLEAVQAVADAEDGIDIVQHKRQANQSVISVIADSAKPHEKIVCKHGGFLTFFVKSPHLWVFEAETNRVNRFALGSWHQQKHLLLEAPMPSRSSTVTALLNWSLEAQYFIWLGLNHELNQKTVKINEKQAHFWKK